MLKIYFAHITSQLKNRPRKIEKIKVGAIWYLLPANEHSQSGLNCVDFGRIGCDD